MRLQRVVVLNDFGSVVGGAANVAIASACGLATTGLTVDFVCGVGPLSPALLAAGVNTHCLLQHDILSDPNRLRAMVRGLWNRTAAARLRSLLQECDPRGTIVHLHSWTKNLSPSVIGPVIAAGVPLVVTVHDYFTACPNGGFFDYPRVAVCHRRAMSTSCVVADCDARHYGHKVWRVTRQLVSAHLAGIPKAVRSLIYVSDLSKRVLEPYFSADTEWFRVDYPVDVTRASRVHAENNREFLFVGRLAPEKGAMLFAEAAARLGVRALIVGDGPERAKIERSWPNVEIRGWLPRNQVQTEMQRARTLVFPSLWYEGQPLVVLEALAAGIPVLAGDNNGAKESVQHGITGLLFRQGDVDALTAAMRAMFDGPNVERMSRAAYDCYWSNPRDLSKHCTELINVYNRVSERVR